MHHKHRDLLPFIGMASGVSVATIYYNQPLLFKISQAFAVSPAHAGSIAFSTQVGYAIGILLFVPLGDVAERRGLIVKLFAAVSLALVAAGFAPTLGVLAAASVALGITAAVTHILVPMAPDLAEPDESGRAIGIVMTGLLLGILLSRAGSGWIAALLGWRAVFFVAAALSATLCPLLWWRLPHLPASQSVGYGEALASLWRITLQEHALRKASVLGFLAFAAFSSFWTNLAFLLGTPHYGMGPGVAGTFGVLGAAGALAAGFAGRMSDRRGTHAVITLGLGLLIAGYVVLWIFGYHLAGLVVGVLVLDVGQQSFQIANQTSIFSLQPGARSRINTVYMIVFFMGGATGSAISSLAWMHWQWNGVCALGLGLLLVAGAIHSLWHDTTPANAS